MALFLFNIWSNVAYCITYSKFDYEFVVQSLFDANSKYANYAVVILGLVRCVDTSSTTGSQYLKCQSEYSRR